MPDAGGPYQHEYAGGFGRVLDAGMGRLDHLFNGLQPVVLADDALLEALGKVEHRCDLVGKHTSRGNARPTGNHGGHGFRIHGDLNQGIVALALFQFGFQFLELLLLGGNLLFGVIALFDQGMDFLIQVPYLSGHLHFALPLFRQFGHFGLGGLPLFGQFGQAVVVIPADGRFPLENLDFPVDVSNVSLSLLHGRRAGGQSDGYPGAGGVEYAHRLVRQLTTGNIAAGKVHRVGPKLRR